MVAGCVGRNFAQQWQQQQQQCRNTYHQAFVSAPAPRQAAPSILLPPTEALSIQPASPVEVLRGQDSSISTSGSDVESQPGVFFTCMSICFLTLACSVLAGPALAAVPQAASMVSRGPDFNVVLSKAMGSAMKGGFAGLLAGVLQVFSFMWLRTSMNYQYYNGGSLQSALSALWEEGGVRRLYQGISLALVQAPLSRFGDTAANAGVLVFMDAYFPEAPLPLKTAAASTAAGLWRIFLTPIDTLKTVRQVRGDEGMAVLMDRVQRRGPGELYAGAFASFAANWAGNFPYFAVFNSLSETWPAPDDTAARIVRNGVMGMCASGSSDIVSNSLRVLKTLRQSSADPEMGYLEAAKQVIEKDGLLGFLGRGLETRLLVNVLQGTFFTIVWKLIEDSLGR